jgi:hypothetical protein
MTFRELPNEVVKLLERDVVLPQTYQNAIVALSQCNEVDECKEWKDKAAALASYAKQAHDETLYKYAVRISNRATRRCGELLKQFDARNGQNLPNTKIVDSVDFSLTQRQAAEQSGLTERQELTAVRIANIPEERFNELVESENVPTMTKLAEIGKKPQINKDHEIFQPKPKGFTDAIYMSGAIEDLSKMMQQHDANYIIGGANDRHIETIKKNIKIIETWFDTFMINV